LVAYSEDIGKDFTRLDSVIRGNPGGWLLNEVTVIVITFL